MAQSVWTGGSHHTGLAALPHENIQKRGIEELGAEFVLDEFHISEYIKRMVLAIGEETAEQEIREIIRGGKNKE